MKTTDLTECVNSTSQAHINTRQMTETQKDRERNLEEN
uniref:Uncharacterized protein n=1 Tax=Rhizophora mucronata TaxID=61149 RepID=A0A2P2IY05_RHIMU